MDCCLKRQTQFDIIPRMSKLEGNMILSILRCPSFTSDYVTVHWPNSGSQNEPSNEFAKLAKWAI